MKTIVLLTISNVFMTFAWYAHLRDLAGRKWIVAAFISWGIALFEYLIQVPANRIGYTQLSLSQLKIMQEVNGRYTQYYNRRYKRAGPLFQGRYKAKLIDQDCYSLQLSRYIHLNPVKAGIVRHPGQWQWSSYRAFMGQVKGPEFLEKNWLMKQTGDHPAFEHYTLAGLRDAWDPLKPAGDGPVLGRESFVNKVKKKLAGRKTETSLTGLRALRKGDRVKEIEKLVQGLECEEKLKRKLLMYGWRRYTNLSLKEVSERVKAKSPVAVSQAVRRLTLDAQSDKRLGKFVRKIRMSNVKP